MSIKQVVVAGGGVLGSQIGYQAAFAGFQVTFWLRSQDSIARAKPKVETLYRTYRAELEAARLTAGQPGAVYSRGLLPDPAAVTPQLIDEKLQANEAAFRSIRYETDMAIAFADADLIIESMTENPQDKIAFYQAAAPHIAEKTILVTNSSSMLPSTFAPYTGRPEKYLALHFANTIWKHNTAEVMGHAGTDPQYYNEVVAYARQMGMIPLQLHKEQPGYILNSLLIPFLNAAEALLAAGVSDPATIDLTWQLGTGAPAGPFRILDIVGLKTAYDIVVMDPRTQDPNSVQSKIAATLKEKIDQGKTGVAAGEGFYKY